ncbi:MAG: hypothetical protein LUD69_01035, partial [Oscillospiraceae bacterium]|nr:hypothetical protein [Oscillospiraceae bacterium]
VNATYQMPGVAFTLEIEGFRGSLYTLKENACIYPPGVVQFVRLNCGRSSAAGISSAHERLKMRRKSWIY